MTDIANTPVIPAPAPAAPAPVAPAALPAPPPAAAGPLSEADRIARGQAAMRAARAALEAKNPPPASAPAPAAPAAPVAPPAAAAPAPVPPAPAAAPPAAPVAPPEPQPTPAQKNAWESIHAAEKKLSEERAAFKKEREEYARQAQPAQPPVDLRADPFGALRQAGWDDERLAQALVDRMKGGQPAPVAPPAPAVAPPAPGEPGELEKLRAFAGSLADTILKTRYEIAAQAPDFELIRGEPNYTEIAMERAWRHLEQTGERLTEAQALAMVQDELVAQMQQTLQRQSDPRWQRALKLSGSPAPTAPSGQPTQASPPTVAAPPAPTTLTNDFAAPGTLPQPATSPLTELERHQRAINAMRARRGQ